LVRRRRKKRGTVYPYRPGKGGKKKKKGHAQSKCVVNRESPKPVQGEGWGKKSGRVDPFLLFPIRRKKA